MGKRTSLFCTVVSDEGKKNFLWQGHLKVCLEDLDLFLREGRPHPLRFLLRMRLSFAIF